MVVFSSLVELQTTKVKVRDANITEMPKLFFFASQVVRFASSKDHGDQIMGVAMLAVPRTADFFEYG